jgi:NitT/TauT family transport system permease protein
LDRARVLGGALRVAYLVSASATGVLPKTPMIVEHGRLVLHLGDVAPKALLALLLVFFPVAADMAEGLTQVNPDMLRLLRSYHATRWQTFVKLRLPHSVGYLVAGMKVAAPLALIGAVVGEFVGANRGIGFVILDAAARLATVEMLAGIVYVGLTGTALFLAVEILERPLGRWLAVRG